MRALDNLLPAIAGRFQVLDGWRGVSILFVLAAHFLPLGPKSWQLNATAGPLGMSLFFTLSGFLITNFLLHHSSVVDFLIRRICRIVPLAWLCMAVVLPLVDAPFGAYPAHFLFYANLPPIQLTEVAGHLWSLCVEMQFYVGVALLFWTLGARGLQLLPVLCLMVTGYRIAVGAEISIVTYARVDEILAGGVLALIYNGKLGMFCQDRLKSANHYFLLILLLISCHPESGFANYFRPYLAAMLVGATLFNGESQLALAMKGRVLSYIAAISYALYVVHPLFAHTWLGEGEKLVKYAKRPLLLAVIFMVAHVSTFYYEQWWIAFGKQLTSRLKARSSERVNPD